MFESDSAELHVELIGRTAVITLNRPEARNAITADMFRNLRRAIAWVRDDRDVGGVLVTGAGEAFCAGGDVKAMGARDSDRSTTEPRASATRTHEQIYQETRARHHPLAGELRALRKPSVAAIPGATAGAGLAIALACDIRVASETAVFATGYVRLGLSGDCGVAWLLTRIVGPGRARELLLTGRRVGAADAFAIGLVSEVTPPAELPSRGLELAQQLANGPTVAIDYIKQNLDEAFLVDHATAIDREADRLVKCRSTADYEAAVRAFAQKTEPRFTGE